jgi:redox-sensing transcriptional repressor
VRRTPPPESIEHSIPEQTLRRIPQYHQILAEMQARGQANVSSRQLAQFFQIDDTQVRKDVSLIGYKGKPKAGYSILGLKQAIEEFLGINYENTAILIGAGHLGSALSQYPGLAQYGLRLVAIFDNDQAKQGTVLGAFTILPMESLVRVVRSFDVGIAILCVPKEAAQQVASRVVSLGIKAIWNFSPTQLAVPTDVVVRNENIALGLAILSHYVKKQKQDSRPAAGDAAADSPPPEIIEIFNRFQPKRELLVPILEAAQKAFGYVPERAITHIAGFLGVSPEHVREVVSFYPVFLREAPARHRIQVCGGPSCAKKGSRALLDLISRELKIGPGETTPDCQFSLETIPCLGLCSQGPNVAVNDRPLGPMTPELLAERLRALGTRAPRGQ